MIRTLFATFALVFAAACAEGATPAAPTPDRAAATTSQASARPAQPKGETASYVIEGDVVKVNNRICAVSRSPMGDETLGQHVSRVRYDGPDPRFAGKTLEFNQCCPMCLDRFPAVWAERRDEVLRFHGLIDEG